MKVVVFGASGTIGQALVAALSPRHEVIGVGRNGAQQADMSERAQVRALFERLGPVDAVVVAAGATHFGPLAEMSDAQLMFGLQQKLMGQVNVALEAARVLPAGGSITLTSGIVGTTGVRNGAAAAMANGAIDAFVIGAAHEMPRGIRLNVVSPNVLVESLSKEKYRAAFPGFEGVTAARAALGYVRAIEGVQHGEVIRVW
ncbi:short chain dehydrogenase [Massilia sp. TS11]|uniref:short chain dehydrogenase n=1 Tax=Massilia sp. TS11 TaxID=2908003 RepID=UPI001EDA0CDB|nr:short chain dehydrogenase [Massilia sp. TS11]MCG2582741.1 short chain dehydrogenase [Massilia sp. TS11]